MRPETHPGEQAVQRRAGEGGPGWGSPMFDGELSGGFAAFLERQFMLVLSSTDAEGRVWTTTVAGPPGFARAIDARSIAIDAVPAEGDPLAAALDGGADVGILALEPQTRRRIRINGTVARRDGGLLVRTEQVLGNCPKYLQVRDVVAIADPVRPVRPIVGEALTDAQLAWIEGADTFFIGSRSPGHGADASHRGGDPGFVRAEPRLLRWPDYRGNSFYMTLGNVELDPAAGLLFVDWEMGDTLQLTGRCGVDWDPAATAGMPGALRAVEFAVERVVHLPGASPLRWKLLDRSPHNPPACVRP